MKSGPDRRYTPEFRDAAVKQVTEGGRSVAAVCSFVGDVEQVACELGVSRP